MRFERLELKLVSARDDSYRIDIARGLLAEAPADLAASGWGGKYAVVCDSNTGPLYAEDFARRLGRAGAEAHMLEVPAGEKSKSLAVLEDLLNRMKAKGFTRADCVAAVGGGMAGDLAGFAAGTFMRGIPFVQVPTSLLAQVDSSVGGKVAVNIAQGKNYCGLFHQPKRVYIDLDTLNTLPPDELKSGLAEVAKYAVIRDPELFALLAREPEAVLAPDPDLMADIVKRCCGIKARVVEADEREGGVRMILNYGHTLGHAIEEYPGSALAHGLCVAYGMKVMAYVAEELGLLTAAETKAHNGMLHGLGLAADPLPLDPGRVMDLARGDKKARKGRLVFVLPKGIGGTVIRDDLDPDMVKTHLARVLR